MKRPAVHSLRFRLTAASLAAITLVWIVVAIGAWYAAIAEADRLFDHHLSQFARIMAGLVSDDSAEEEIAEHLESPGFLPQTTTQVWSQGEKLLFRTADAPTQRLSMLDAGFADSMVGGERWRVYSTWDDKHRYLVQVAESVGMRAAIKDEMATHLLLPLALALPLLAAALVWLIGANLGSLTRLAESIAQRSPAHLEAISLSGAPRELHPILEQLNRLLARVGVSMEQERRFTADAAHELRTPLAAMRAHAQVARASRDEDERNHALDCMIEGSDRTTRLVEQLLTLARLDAQHIGEQFAPVDLRRIVAEVLVVEAPLALAKSIELVLEDGPAAEMRGNPVLLAILVRNLVDNAVRYSPVGSTITVGVELAQAALVLAVSDDGPGIPETERRRVLERFTRISEQQETGSGLGLSIVARIAELHSALLELTAGAEGKGLHVRVIFSRT